MVMVMVMTMVMIMLMVVVVVKAMVFVMLSSHAFILPRNTLHKSLNPNLFFRKAEPLIFFRQKTVRDVFAGSTSEQQKGG